MVEETTTVARPKNVTVKETVRFAAIRQGASVKLDVALVADDSGDGYTEASITIGDVRMSDGASLEKVGVVPDETVLPTAADLAAGRDPVLARAIALAGGSITPETASRLFSDRK